MLTCTALCCTTFKSPRNLMNQTLCRQVQHRKIDRLYVLFQWDTMYRCCLLSFSIPTAGKAMWERLTAPEDGFSKLQRENLAIIESYGKALMEVVCRDACDGHEISRVRAKQQQQGSCTHSAVFRQSYRLPSQTLLSVLTLSSCLLSLSVRC